MGSLTIMAWIALGAVLFVAVFGYAIFSRKDVGVLPIVRAERVEEMPEHNHAEVERPAAIRDGVAQDTGTAAMPDPGSEFFKDPQPLPVPWSAELMQPMSTYDCS
jgi:hypothetical protein